MVISNSQNGHLGNTALSHSRSLSRSLADDDRVRPNYLVLGEEEKACQYLLVYWPRISATRSRQK